MENIIAPISKELIKEELTPDKQLRMTNKSHNEIYIVTQHNAPNILQEIGRLREIAFRAAGVVPGAQLILMNMIRWIIVTSNLSYGILKLRKL